MNRQKIILSEKKNNKKKLMRRLSNPVLQNHILLQMVDFLIAGHKCQFFPNTYMILSKINIVMKQTVPLSAQEWQAFALEIHILLLLHFQIVNVDLLFVGDNLNAEWLFSQVIYQQ